MISNLTRARFVFLGPAAAGLLLGAACTPTTPPASMVPPAPTAPPAAATAVAQTGATAAAVAPTVAAAAAPAATAFSKAAPTVAAAANTAVAKVIGGAPAATQPVTLTFWHGMNAGPQENALKALVEDFKKVRPEVTINLDYTSYSGGALQQKVMASIAARTTPDLVMGFPNDTSAWYDAGAVVPMDDYLNGPNGLQPADRDDIFPSLLRESQFPQYQNRTLAFPFNKSIEGLMVYNVPMLKAAGYDTLPATWDQFEQMCAKLVKPDVQCYVIQPSASRTVLQMYGHGTDVLAPDFKSVVFGPSVEQWFEQARRLVESKYAYVSRDFSWQNEFAAGKLAVGATTSTGDSFIENLVKGSFEYAFAPMPVAAGQQPNFSVSGTNLVIFKSDAARQQAAWDFIKWATQKEQTLRWAMATGYVPVRKSAAADPAYTDYLAKKPRFNTVIGALPNARNDPFIAAWGEIRGFIQDAENKVVSLSATPKAAAEELVSKSNAALQR